MGVDGQDFQIRKLTDPQHPSGADENGSMRSAGSVVLGAELDLFRSGQDGGRRLSHAFESL
jgi:hypothetical protein